MKLARLARFAFSAVGLLVSGGLLSASSRTAAVKMASPPSSGERDVIVIMRDQLAQMAPIRGGHPERRAAAVASQAPLVDELQRTRQRPLKSFHLVNAFAARLSQAEIDRLAAHPAVQKVVPDAAILAPRHSRVNEGPAAELHGGNGAPRGPASQAAISPQTASSALCNTLEPEALQVTNAAFLDPTKPQAQRVVDGNGKMVTGQGVKVAWIADGIDTTHPGFTRPDGSNVFVDYQNFNGDPEGTPTGGGEAFLDASSIAAQDMPNGTPLYYDISQYANLTAAALLPSPCNIRVRGIAPGVSLVGLNVFGATTTTTSNFVQAIEYAVETDVDVINESFGGNPFYDNGQDPISLADVAAVQAGVTVVVSTGDAGTAGTLGSPSTNPNVIAAGASTTFRVYQQIGDGLFGLGTSALAGAPTGYIDNNISSLSSGGFSQKNARTVDVVAPGDLNWTLCSTNSALFEECGSFNPAHPTTSIAESGGTSESSPLTAGVAALVIQAYRSTHQGTSPSPAVVKQIIMSTATDLGAPSFEQGAGLLNALAAVQAALSYGEPFARPRPQGASLVALPNSVEITDYPGSVEERVFEVTNTGSATRRLQPVLQTLGAPFAHANFDVTLTPATDPQFVFVNGRTRTYVKHTFVVPSGADHLDASMAFPSVDDINDGGGSAVWLGLIDPSGKQAAFSLPQGSGNGYGHVDVVKPAGGTWTAVFFTRLPGVTGSVAGTVHFSWSAERYVNMGAVFPAVLTLPPGATGLVAALFQMPSQAGDVASGLRFNSLDGAPVPEIPVTLRSLINTSRNGGSFSGTLTGGNARGGAGPTSTFAFDVPSGATDMAVTVTDTDSTYPLEGVLIDPTGTAIGVKGNLDPTENTASTFVAGLQVFHNNPIPGRWRFILVQNFVSSSHQTSLPYTGHIVFNGARVSAVGLPNNSGIVLSASGAPHQVAVHITNTGPVAESYYADARLAASAQIDISNDVFGCSANPVALPGACLLAVLPPHVSNAQFAVQSLDATNNPGPAINMDVSNDLGFGIGFTGSPDVYAQPIGDSTVVASVTAPELTPGNWFVVPSEMGPYGPSGATPASIGWQFLLTLQPFDNAVASDAGNPWSDFFNGTSTYRGGLIVPSGQSGTINLSISPDPTQVGKTVSGWLYVSTFNGNVGDAVENSADEVVRIPYRYTVGP
jgi:hypothetical protein